MTVRDQKTFLGNRLRLFSKASNGVWIFSIFVTVSSLLLYGEKKAWKDFNHALLSVDRRQNKEQCH